MSTYRHTQFGTVGFVITLVVMLVGVLPLLLTGKTSVALPMLGILLAALLLFLNLNIEINAEHLRIRFGIGLIRKRFHLEQIETCRPVRNRWFYGWGIRLTPHGWLYNVSGLGAVELKMKSGKTSRIGSDEPEVLAAALREALNTPVTDLRHLNAPNT